MFSLEKKRWESRAGKAEDVTTLLRREATSLVKYKHPCVLGIVEPLQESHKALAFATENVHASLFHLFEKNQFKDVY